VCDTGNDRVQASWIILQNSFFAPIYKHN
jgi:hypothetical protein